MKKVIFCLCISGIIAAIAIYMYSLNGKDKKQVDNSQVSNKNEIKHDIVNNPIVSKDAKEVNLSCHDYFVKEMNEMNFNTELIEKIFDCNEMVFTSWYEYNSKELKRQIGTFSSLKGQTEIQLRLVNAPDVATLVAAVASKHNGIESSNAILDSIPSDSEDGNIVRSLYALNATPNEAMHLAQLLCYDSNQKYIIELYKQSHGDLLYLKSFLKFFELLEENREKAPYAAKVYKEWLYSLLNQMLEMEPESDDADNIYLLLLSQSEPLMEALKSNKEFCNHFFDKYWNDYLKLLNSIPKNDKYKDEKFIS